MLAKDVFLRRFNKVCVCVCVWGGGGGGGGVKLKGIICRIVNLILIENEKTNV